MGKLVTTKGGGRVASKRDDLVKYITEQVVTFIETPKEERKAKHSTKAKEPWTVHWFGVIPDSLRLLFGGRKR